MTALGKNQPQGNVELFALAMKLCNLWINNISVWLGHFEMASTRHHKSKLK